MLSLIPGQKGASAGLLEMVQVALWLPECSPSCVPSPASALPLFPDTRGMGDGVSDRRLQLRMGAGEAGLWNSSWAQAGVLSKP